jgi:hypothetical protein
VLAQNAQLFTFSPTEFFALSSPLDRTARMAGLLGIVPARSRQANGKLAVYRKFRALTFSVSMCRQGFSTSTWAINLYDVLHRLQKQVLQALVMICTDVL